jgi:hypothetical protein
VIALKHRVQTFVIVALTTLAAANGGGFIDNWLINR